MDFGFGDCFDVVGDYGGLVFVDNFEEIIFGNGVYVFFLGIVMGLEMLYIDFWVELLVCCC